MTTGTTGTGTITLGSAVSSFLTFAQAGVTNGMTVRYSIEDGVNREVGSGVYTTSGTTLTRSVLLSTNSNNAINLSGSAQVSLTALAEDITNKTGDTMTGALNWATTVTLASASTVNIGAAASNFISITGVATINAFDTIAAGAERTVVFAGALTITNSASIICLGGANVATQAGDTAIFSSEGAGVWRMTGYHRANGNAIVPSINFKNVQVFTASGTYTPTSGATRALVIGTGGGGAFSLGGSVGSGATFWLYTAVSGTVSVTIGAGSNGSTNGGATTFAGATANGGNASAAATATGGTLNISGSASTGGFSPQPSFAGFWGGYPAYGGMGASAGANGVLVIMEF